MVGYITISLLGIYTTKVAINLVQLPIISEIIFVCLYKFVVMEIDVTALWLSQLAASLTDKIQT